MKTSELKSLIMESLLEALNEEDVDHEYKMGVNYAVRVKQGKARGLDEEDLKAKHLSKAFIKGYVSVMGGGLWNKVNSALTGFLSGLGSSRTKRL